MNEDRVGSTTGAGWALDGATGYGRVPEEDQSALELVDLLDAEFEAAAHRHEDALQILRSGIKAVRRSANPKFSLPKADRPSSAGVVCSLLDDELSFAGVGDTSFLALIGDHLVCVSDCASGARELRQVSYANRREGVRASRAQMNSAEGYWVLSREEETVDHAWSGALRVHAGDLVLLATDGLLRLVEVYDEIRIRELVDQLAAGKGPELVSRLRELERQNPSALHIKQHDDASWVLLMVEARTVNER